MTLGDLENAVLSTLQEPGSSFAVPTAPGAAPTWGSLNQPPQYGQGLIDFWINEGYKHLMMDLADLNIALVSAVVLSTVNTYKYAIPPTGSPKIGRPARIYHNPKGLPYTRELTRGDKFVDWEEFNRHTGWGYLAPYSFGTEPNYATFDPLRQNLYLYPGSAVAGDTITIQYTPIPTSGATLCPLLANETDVPILPDDTHMAIFYYAMGMLWYRARAFTVALQFFNNSPDSPGFYQNEIRNIRATYTKITDADTKRIVPAVPIVASEL